MAKIRVKRAATIPGSNFKLQSGELGLIGDNLYFGNWTNGEVGSTPTRIANQNANNDFTGVSSFLPSSSNTPNVKFFNYVESPAAPTEITYVENGRIYTVDPTAPQQVATKSYVDAVAQGLNIKESVRVATTESLNLVSHGTGGKYRFPNTGILPTIDGIESSELAPNDRILVKNESNREYNGIYYIEEMGDENTYAILQRSVDADNISKLVSAFVFVEKGTINADTGWVCTIDIGGIYIDWTQFSGAGSFSAATGGGLIANGTEFSIDTTVTMDLSSAQAITGNKTFDSSKLRMKASGSGTGVTTIANANTSATNYTLTLPAKTGTLAVMGDLHGQSHEMTSASDHTAGNWKMFYSNGSGKVVEIPLSSTSGYVLKSNGGTAAPTWQADNNTTYSAAANGGLKLEGTAFSLNTETPITNEETGQVLVHGDEDGVLYRGFLAYDGSTGTLAVNATSATIASAVSTTSEETGTTPRYILFADNNSTSNQALKTDSGLTYHPTNNALTATTFIGSLSGTATKATHLVGGNSTTLKGAIPYQSNSDTTTLLAPNTSATRKYLSMVGTGTNGAIPSWEQITIPTGFTLASTILEGGFNSLNPYSDRTEGKLYVNDTPPTPMGNKAPTSVGYHLGFNGIFYATKFEGIIDGGDWE